LTPVSDEGGAAKGADAGKKSGDAKTETDGKDKGSKDDAKVIKNVVHID